jgi:AbrB family looped-hinge helix DNA binding protein
MASDVLKVSSNGQVSIPARVRRRWNAARVLVVDKGDRIIIRPVLADPLSEVVGKYAHVTPSSDAMRRDSRAEDDLAESLRG